MSNSRNGNAKPLNIRRNYDGGYSEGTSDMLPVYDKNLFGSIYIGKDNPTYKDELGEDQDDFRYEPQDEVDEAAYEHDKAYNAKKAKGVDGAFFNREVIPADDKLVADSRRVLKKYHSRGVDRKTGLPVSLETRRRAFHVQDFFSAVREMLKPDRKKSLYTKSSPYAPDATNVAPSAKPKLK